MDKKKVCMVGDFSVGKTSLTQKFVNNVFSDQYLTTIGVKIDTAIVGDTKLIVWDVAGRDSLSPINVSYLVGAAGIVLVADGTRSETINDLHSIWETVQERIGDVPRKICRSGQSHRNNLSHLNNEVGEYLKLAQSRGRR